MEGMNGALAKWETRVTATIDLCRAAEYMKPASWVLDGNMSKFPLTLPDNLFEYGKHSSETKNGGQVEWRRYRRVLEELYKTVTSAEGTSDGLLCKEEVKRKVSSPQSFWEAHKPRLPCLYKLSISVLCFCPSAAEVERSFKKLRSILPKNHTRDRIKEMSLRREMFFSFNKGKLALFQ